jgi:hypothetical protein
MRASLFLLSLCWSLVASEEGLALRRIADFWEEGEYRIAKSQMEEFLELYPDSSYANTLCTALGDLFLREKNYQKALEYYANGEDVFLNRLQCLYHLQWHATLSDECEAYLKTSGSHHLQATYFLAIALYSQALQAENPRMFAERAKPYFETLAGSELSDEVAGAYAHLRYLLGDYEEASKIYLEMAGDSTELLFQAAVMQAKFNPPLALETLSKIQTPQAAFHRLILLHDLGRYDEIVAQKEDFLQSVPAGKVDLAHLIVGRSYLALDQREESIKELKAFLEMTNETGGPALAQLSEAAYQLGNLEMLESAIARMEVKSDAQFYRALLLKKFERWEEAADQLKAIPQSPEALLELAQVEAKLNHWTEAKEAAKSLLSNYPESPLVPFAWQYAAGAAIELRSVSELEELLKTAPDESWRLQHAKLLYETGEYRRALEYVNDSPNGELLRALCLQNLGEEFIEWAEAALAHLADWMPLDAQRMALFNAYVARSEFDKAKEHLFGAFELGAEIQRPNLLWLAEVAQGEMAYRVLLQLDLKEPEFALKLAKLHRQFGHEDEAIALLESLDLPEARLELGQLVLPSDPSRAEQLFDAAAASDTYRDGIAAKAALASARLKRDAGRVDEAAIIFKNLVLQKNLLNEPLHQQASLDYIQLFPEKRLELLKKTKSDFESTDDLLSKDYQAARSKYADKDEIYCAYIRYLEGEIGKYEAQ